MERRAFLATLAGGLFPAPLIARAQQSDRIYRIGILANVPLSDPGSARLWGAFTDVLKDFGYVPGRNSSIEFLSSDGKYDRLPALAAELVRRKVDIIVAPAAQNVVAAKQASQTIPIVMASVGDPVGNGLVASLARPGSNVTGTSFLTSALVGKQLELLKQIASSASRLAILLNPANPGHPLTLEEARVAAPSLGYNCKRWRCESRATSTTRLRRHGGSVRAASSSRGTAHSSSTSYESPSSLREPDCPHCMVSETTSMREA